ERPFCLFECLDRREDRLRITLSPWLVMPGPRFRLRPVACGRELDILRDVDQHRPRTTLRRDVEGLMDDVGEVGGITYQPVVLGAGAGDSDSIRFLEGIVADHEGRNLTAEDD